MIIKNNRTGMTSLGYNHDGKAGQINLIPGFNDNIDADDFANACKNPAVKELIDDGIIEIADHGKKSSKKEKQVYELIAAEKNVKKAIDDVKFCIVVEQLEGIIQNEKRKGVLAAAKEQLAAIQAPTIHRKESNDEKTGE